MLWKECADDTDRWLGADHKVESPGFFMLKTIPVGRPLVSPPELKLMRQKFINEMTSAAMLKQFKAHVTEKQAVDSIKWLRKCATTCKIPYDLVPVQQGDGDVDGILRSSWGPAVKVGVPGLQGDFFLMEDQQGNDAHEFWKLPVDIQSMVDGEILLALEARRQLEGLPFLRYERPAADALINRERPKKKPKAVSKARTVNASTVSGDDEEENKEEEKKDEVEEEEEEEELEQGSAKDNDYGEKFELCKVGHIACVLTDFEDTAGGTGLEFYQVEYVHESVAGDDEEDYFTATTRYRPATNGMLVTDPACLKNKWSKIAKRKTTPVSTIQGWQVLCYFKQFNKAGKDFKISPNDCDRILAKGKEHKLVLFESASSRDHALPYEDLPMEVEEGDEEIAEDDE